jgi:ligand-binding sensor domain-containing protein
MRPHLHILRKIAISLITWIILVPAWAQYPYIQKIRLAVPDLEPVFCKAIQDENGYFWLGSDLGLFRFDGLDVRRYALQDDSADLPVTALCRGDNRVIWVGCGNGRIYKLENNLLSLFDPEEGTADKAITDIVIDKNHDLWWSTAGEGLYCSKENRVYNFNHDDGLKDDYVYDLEICQDNSVWAGTDAGLYEISFTDGKKEVSPLPEQIRKQLQDIIVRVVREDPEGRLWLGFQDGGTGYLNPRRNGFVSCVDQKGWNYGTVQDIEVIRGGAWIATSYGRIIEIDAEKYPVRSEQITPVDEGNGKINDLQKDNEGNIWILSSKGLYRSTGDRLRFFSSLLQKPLLNIHAIKNDNQNPDILWFSDDEGLFSADISTGRTTQYLANFSAADLKITCLNQDRYGFLWAGTFNYGLFRIRPSDGTWSQITESRGLVNNNVLSISRHEDTLWMATLGGASEIVLAGNSLNSPFRITSFNYETGLVNNFIYAVYEDNHDQIWLATDGDGVNVKTKKGWVSYNEKEGLTDDVIYSVTGDKSGNIWVASASSGIFKFTGDRFVRIGTDEGLSSHSVSGMSVSGDELLVVQDNGIDVLNVPTGMVAHYGEEIGLNGISPDLNVISQDKDGYIWIGTQKGIIRYCPGSAGTAYSPRTVLEEMSVYMEPRQMSENMSLAFDENHVSFKYAGIWLSNPGDVSYQVLLEGYDLGWKNTYDRQVTYSNLSPGKYIFKVRSSIDHSFSNIPETGLSFRILEPFWLNDWFILFLVLALALAIFLYIKTRENRLKKKEQEKKEKVEFEFQVLKNQVNPHFLFNSFSTLMSLIEEQPREALEYTEKLSDFFRTILQFKDQEVISLDTELNLVGNYFFLLKKRFGDNIRLDILLDEETVKTFIPPMTLQLLIENAVKHNIVSKDKPLNIKVYKENSKIIIENNLQPKLTPEVSTGIGLENIRKRYRLITRVEPEVEKTADRFKVVLPVIR